MKSLTQKVWGDQRCVHCKCAADLAAAQLRQTWTDLWKSDENLPPRSQMTLKGERSKAVTTSLPQMFQMECINCINFTISSSDLHTHTRNIGNTFVVSMHCRKSFIFCKRSPKGGFLLPHTHTHTASCTKSCPVGTPCCVRARQGEAEQKSLWWLLLLWGVSTSSTSTPPCHEGTVHTNSLQFVTEFIQTSG